MNEKKELRMISNFSCFIADITALRHRLSPVEILCSKKTTLINWMTMKTRWTDVIEKDEIFYVNIKWNVPTWKWDLLQCKHLILIHHFGENRFCYRSNQSLNKIAIVCPVRNTFPHIYNVMHSTCYHSSGPPTLLYVISRILSNHCTN